MITAIQAQRLAEAAEMAQVWDCTMEEAIEELLWHHFGAAGFREEQIVDELSKMNSEKQTAFFLNL